MSIAAAGCATLTPKTGPKEGSRKAIAEFLFLILKASPKPTETVVFPSPADVGEMAVTKISFLSGKFDFKAERFTFALYLPYSSKSSVGIPAFGQSLELVVSLLSVQFQYPIVESSLSS